MIARTIIVQAIKKTENRILKVERQFIQVIRKNQVKKKLENINRKKTV